MLLPFRYHTDGRTFLGPAPVIASLSLGETATFQMRKMTNVWPCSGTPNGGVDASEPVQDYPVGHGDLLVMLGKTQDHWHHRVPKEKGRRPRLNINFRYIVGGTKGFDIILDRITHFPALHHPSCGVRRDLLGGHLRVGC